MPGVTFSYKGTEMPDSSLIAPGTRTLKLQGKYCEGAIVTSYTNPDIEIKPKKDGLTRLYLVIPTQCDLSKLNIPLYWNQSVRHGVTIDWGDGKPQFKSLNTGNLTTSHNYEEGGNYIITMTRNDENCVIKLGHGGSGTGLLGETGTSSNIYRSVLKGFETGDGVRELAAYCCQRYTSLSTVIFGKDLVKLGNYCFNYCYNIGSLRWLGPDLPVNNNIGGTNTWNNVPVWCKVYVPPAYMNGNTAQNIPSRMPSKSTYTYAVEPYAYTAE